MKIKLKILFKLMQKISLILALNIFICILFRLAIHNSNHDLVCTSSKDSSSTENPSPINFALVFKYGFLLLALLAMPFVFFKIIIVPAILLIGLKAATLLNSFLLASLLYHFKFWKQNQNNNPNNDMNNGVNQGSNQGANKGSNQGSKSGLESGSTVGSNGGSTTGNRIGFNIGIPDNNSDKYKLV